MTEALSIVQIILLAVIAWAVLHPRKERERVLEADLVDRGVWQELHRDATGWHLHRWVRENTPAWQQAFDTPGVALRHNDNDRIVEGKQ